MPGILYLVSTPIGNLEDITRRAARVLSQVDLIACEDTRQTRKLLNHLGIDKAIASYHEHNEVGRSAWLLEKILAGASVALVSDAGTPLVSDPGFVLVREAIGRGVTVVPVPGPSALLAALAASGLPVDAFYFAGFLPAKAAQRRRALEKLQSLDCTLVFYEAPHRILDTLSDLAGVFGERPVALARELTKMHEEFLRGTAASIRDVLAVRQAVKGELTIVVGPAVPSPETTADPTAVRATVAELVRQGVPRMEAIKAAGRAHGLSKREVYRMTQESIRRHRGAGFRGGTGEAGLDKL